MLPTGLCRIADAGHRLATVPSQGKQGAPTCRGLRFPVVPGAGTTIGFALDGLTRPVLSGRARLGGGGLLAFWGTTGLFLREEGGLGGGGLFGDG
jgi:hypothetical protein